MRSLTLNRNWKSDIFRPRIFEKFRFEKFTWAYLKDFKLNESELKFEVEWDVYFLFYESKPIIQPFI